jgi:hypothetical protein
MLVVCLALQVVATSSPVSRVVPKVAAAPSPDAELSAEDAEIERAARFLETEVAVVPADQRSPKEFWLALAISGFVQERVSSAHYQSTKRVGAAPTMTSTAQCLMRQSGLCGHQGRAAVDLARRLGVPSRLVQLYWLEKSGKRASHVLVEYEWGGKWRLFDLTWGAYFTRPGGAPYEALSWAELAAGGPFETHRNELDLWLTSNLMVGIDVFSYIERVARGGDPDAGVLIDGVGSVEPALQTDGSYSWAHVADYVGRTTLLPGHPAITDSVQRFDLPRGATRLKVSVRDFNGCSAGETVSVEAGRTRRSFPVGKGEFEASGLPASQQDVLLRVEGTALCVLVLEGARAEL